MGKNKAGRQPARGKQPTKKSKVVANVDEDGIDEDKWAEEEAAAKQPSIEASVPEGGMAGENAKESQADSDGAGNFTVENSLDDIDPGTHFKLFGLFGGSLCHSGRFHRLLL